MRIEEEIQQKEFRNEYQKISINLVYTANWLTDKQRKFFDRYDITTKQYNVLRILKGQYPERISTSEIRERMLDKSSDTSRIVDRLTAQNLVTKQACPSDKRLVDVGISEKGLKLLEIIDANIQGLDHLISTITLAEAKDLNILLDKIRGK
jgi:DNA-binding MarR family transcriptional regulator